MFGYHFYQYGSDPNRIVWMKEKVALVVNTIRFIEDPEDPTRLLTDASREEIALYNQGADILNANIAKHGPVDCDMDTNPVILTKKF